MKNILLVLICLILAIGTAHANAPTPLAYTSTSNPLVQTNVTPTTPLPVCVYDLSNHSGYIYTSNGSGACASFQAGGGGGGSSVVIAATTSNLTYYPTFATTTGGSVTTIYVDTNSPLSYNPTTGISSTSLTLTTTPLGVASGGTGAQTLEQNGVLLGNGTSPVSAVFGVGTTGQFLGANTGSSPTWQSPPGPALASTSSNASYYLGFTTTTGGNLTTLYGNTSELSFNPSTGLLSVLGITTTSLINNGVTSLNGTTTISGALHDTATITLSGIVAGTVSGAQYLGVNSSGTVVYGAGGSTSPATPSLSLQYDNAGSFGGATGLFYSTTRLGLDFLAATTTANLLSLGDNGTDVTSYYLGESAGLAQSITNLDNTGIGGFSLSALTTGTNNTALGWDAGQSITTDGYNTAIGARALLTLAAAGTTSANANNAFGYDALTALTTGVANIAIGNLAGKSITTDGYTLFIGDGAGQNEAAAATTSALGNIGEGYHALNALTTGLANIAIGNLSGSSLTTDGYNTAVGDNTLVTQAASGTTSSTGNTAVGYGAGASMTTGTQNTLLGNLAGKSVSTGANNVYIGNGAGGPSATQSDNTCVGSGSCGANTGAGFATAFGYLADAAMTNGSSTGFGYNACAHATTGTNTCFGAHSGDTTVTTGSANILISDSVTNTDTALNNSTSAIGIGEGAKVGTGDTAIGHQALHASSANNNDNTATGFHSLTADTTGTNNTAVGYQSAKAITTDGFNNAFGVNSLATQAAAGTTSATGNTAIGYAVLTALTTGISNTAVGNNAGVAITTGSQNVAVGNGTLPLATTSTGVIVLGYAAGGVLTTGTNDIYIGAGINATTSTDVGVINFDGIWTVTGAGTPSTAANTINGGMTMPNITTTGTVADAVCVTSAGLFLYESSGLCTVSLRELKDNIQPIVDASALDEIKKLQPVSFNMKDQGGVVKTDTHEQLGFIAEDIEKVDDRCSAYDGNGKLQSYKTNCVLSLAVSALQAQQKQIESIPALQDDPCHNLNWLGRKLFCK